MRLVSVLALVAFGLTGAGYAQSSPASFVKGDFNGDGQPDTVRREICCGGGVYAVYLQDGTKMPVSPDGGGIGIASDQNWRIGGTADFDGDGRTDLLWRNYGSGANAVWLLDGVKYREGHLILGVDDVNWEIGATADFDGDGKPDIVWRNRVTGENAIWFMDGLNYREGVRILSVNDPNWMIMAAGDFNGDMKPDLLWRNFSTGENAVWFMDGSQYVSGTRILEVTDTNWTISGVADLNGDGQTDIIWSKRDPFSVTVHVWFMDGVNYVSGKLMYLESILYDVVGPK
jgi:FG-GAP-like repeat/FG-GAP repeat